MEAKIHSKFWLCKPVCWLPMAEKAAAYGRHVQTIVTEATADRTKTFEGKAAEGQKAFADAMENMTKNAPAGTETAVAAIKTAMSNSQSAIEAAQKLPNKL